MDEKIYSAKEVAELLKIPVSGVQRYIRLGELTAMKLGREYRIMESDLDTFLDNKKKETTKE